jgi:hypothetical protein
VQHSHRATTMHELTKLPEGSELRSVTAVPTEVSGRRALRVELIDAVTLHGKPGVDYVDMPTFVIIPASLENGTIEADVLSRLSGKGPADARPSPASPTASPMVVTALKRSTCARSTDGRPIRPAPGTSAASSTSPTQIGSSTGYAKSSRTDATKRARTSAQTNGSA